MRHSVMGLSGYDINGFKGKSSEFATKMLNRHLSCEGISGKLPKIIGHTTGKLKKMKDN